MNFVEECRLLLRMRQSYGREPRFFYVAPDMELNFLTEVAFMNRHMLAAITMTHERPRYLQLYGLPVIVRRDFPAGFILASETELH